MRILVAEHDVLIARGISLALNAAGFIADHVDRSDEALEMILQFNYDVVLLSEALPGVGGLAVLQEARNGRQGTPVVMLATSPSVKLKVAALRIGADDVMETPVEPDELVARMYAITRRFRGIADLSVRIGNLVVDLGSQQVSCNGEPLKLTGKEFSILELLVLRRGTVLTRDAFMNHLYGGLDEPEMKIIDVFVCKLRKKLQRTGVDDLIINVWGRGYMLKVGRSDVVPVPGLGDPTLVKAAEFTL